MAAGENSLLEFI